MGAETAPALSRLAPSSAPAARPILGLVRRALSAVLGLSALATPPGTPVEHPLALILLAWVRRQTTAALFNRSPNADPAQLIQSGTGVVRGSLNATDVDGDRLVYRVTAEPANGAVELDPDGTYAYTPSAALAGAGGTDTFTVQVRETGFHLHLLGGTRQISVPVSVTVAPVDPATPVTVVAVDGEATELALSPDRRRAYVLNAGADALTVIDTTTGKALATLRVGAVPVDVAVSPNGLRVYTANSNGGTVSVIDATTNTVLGDPIAVGGDPLAVAVSRDSSRVYVANAADDTVSVIDTSTHTVIATITVGALPVSVAVDPNRDRAYVVNALSNSVSVIDTLTNTLLDTDPATPDIIDPITVGDFPTEVAINAAPGQTRAYVVNTGSNSVTVIDTTTNTLLDTNPATPDIIDPISVDTTPTDVAVSPDGTLAYVLQTGNNTLSIIDTTTNTMLKTVAAGTGPGDVAAGSTYVTNSITTGGVGVARDLFDGCTTPGSCNSTGFDIRNFTQNSVEFLGYKVGDTYVQTIPRRVESGPKVGTIITPGENVHFELFTVFGESNIVYPAFRAVTSDGVPTIIYNSALSTRRSFSPAIGVYCESSGGVCSPGTRPAARGNPFGLKLQETTVFLLDKPGTTVRIPAEQLQQQAVFLNNLCYDGSGSSCSFEATSRDLTAYGKPHEVASTRNSSSVNQERTLTVTDTQTRANSFEITAKVGVKVGKLFTSEVTTKYGVTNTTTHTFTDALKVTIPANTTLRVVAEAPVIRVYGDFTLIFGNSTVVIENVAIDSPDPTRALRTAIEPVPPST